MRTFMIAIIPFCVFRTSEIYVGYKPPEASRNGNHDISQRRLDLLVKFLQRSDIITVLPAEWKNYTKEHYFQVNFNPTVLHKKYLAWLESYDKSLLSIDESYVQFKPVSASFMVTLFKHVAFLFLKGGEVCVCPRCKDEGQQTFQEYFPLFFLNIRRIWA